MQRLVSRRVITISWIVIIAVWLFGLWAGLPYRLWWFDVGAHLAGGLWAFGFLLYLARFFEVSVVGNNSVLWIARFCALVGGVMMIGVFWEFGEFVADRYVFKTGFTYLSGTFEDTLLDLLMDMVGGIVGFFVYHSFSRDKIYA